MNKSSLFTKVFLLCLMVVGCVTSAWADNAVISWNMGKDGATATGANAITGASGCAAEGFTIAITGNETKAWSAGNGKFTFDGVEYTSLKNSNGAQNTITCPTGYKATHVKFIVTSNADSSGKLTEFDGTTCSDEVSSLKDYTNPTVIEKDIDNKESFTFTFSTKQVCFIAIVTYTKPATKKTVNFINDAGWDQVFVWAWNSKTGENFTGGKWPGVELNKAEDNTYPWQTTGDPTNIIFSNGNGTQTADLEFKDGGIYNSKGRVINLNDYTVTFTTDGMEEVYAYTWSGNGESKVEQLGAWPGTKMDVDGRAYTITIKAEAAPEHIIFNNGNNGIQTPDLDFEDGKAYEYFLQNFILSFTTDAGWNPTYVYMWTGDKLYTDAWPGTQMNGETFEFSAFEAPANIQFNNGKDKTTDMKFVNGQAYQWITAEPLYKLNVGDAFTAGQSVDVQDAENDVVATITYGTTGNNFTEAVAAPVDGWAGFVAMTAGNGTNGDQDGGTTYTIVPKYDGNITIAVKLNGGKKFYVLEDGTALSNYNGITISEAANTTFSFAVSANKSYKFYCAGSKLGFFGFDYKFKKPEPQPVANTTINFFPGVWSQSEQEASYAAWAWGAAGEPGAWYAYNAEQRTFDIPETCAKIIFVRYNPETQFDQLSWNDVWDKTDDLTITAGKMYEITAWGADGSNSTCVVKAWPPVFFNVNVAENIQNGQVSVDIDSAEEGTTITVTATPDEGYVLDAITVTCDNSNQAVQVAEDGTFTMPADNVTVNATFKEPSIVTTKTLYLKPGVWSADNARFAVRIVDRQNSENNSWADFAPVTDAEGYYQAEIPEDASMVRMFRFDPQTTENSEDADKFWNRTGLIEDLGTNNLVKITGWGDGFDPYELATYPEQGGGDEPIVSYYVVGTMTKWQIENTFQLLPSKTEEGLYEYYGTFAAKDEIKVLGDNNVWYPEGMDNYVFAEAGDYVVSFRPAGNIEGWFGGYFNVAKQGGDDPQPTEPTWEKATSIAVGDVVILTAEGTTKNGDYAVELSELADKIGKVTDYKDTPAGLVELTVEAGKTEGTFAFKTADGKYLAANTSNQLPLKDAIENASSWTVAWTEGVPTITNVDQTSRVIRYNSGSPRFACYTSGQQNVTLWKKVGGGDTPEPVVINSMAIKGTFPGMENWEKEIPMTQDAANTNVWTLTMENVTVEGKKYEYKAFANGETTGYQLPAEGNNDFVFGTNDYPAGEYTLTFTANVKENTLTLVAEKKGDDPQPTEPVVFIFNTDDGIAELGIAKPGVGAGTNLKDIGAHYLQKGNIIIDNADGSTATRVWNTNGTLDLRIYKEGSLTIKTSDKTNIKKIELAGTAVNGFTADSGTFADGTWEGDAKEVLLTATVTGKINTITVTYGEAGDTPAVDTYGIVGDLTGGWPDAGGQDAEMKKVVGKDGVYTLVVTDFEAKAGTEYQYKLRANKSWDGYQLPAEGNQSWTPETDGIYTLTFTAYINENKLELIATKTSINTVAELNALADKTAFKFYGNAIVVAKMAKGNANYVYITDETGSSLIYDADGKSTANIAVGNVLTAPWPGTVSIYNGLFEAKPTDVLGAASTVEVKYPIKTADDVTVENMNNVIELKGLAIASVDDKGNISFTVGNSAIVGYNQFGIELPTEYVDKTFDVVGVVSVYKEKVQFQPITITEAQPQPQPTVEKLYIIGSGTANEWINTTEVAFNEQTNAFEYEITANEDCYIAFGDAELNDDWNTFNGSHRYALEAGKNVVPTIGKALQLILTQGEGCVLLKAGYKYALSVTKDLKLTVTREALPAKKFTATFSNTGNWSEVYAYTFSLDEAGQKVEELGAMPGKKLEAGKDGIFQVEIEASVAPQYIVFNNGVEGEGLIKTANLAFVDGKTYDYKPLNTYTATFSNTGNWSEVYAYTFSKNEAGDVIAQELGKWPGAQLSAGTEGLYQVLIEAENAPQFIIFNNGNGGEGNQTADLKFEDGKAYSYEVEPTPEEKEFTVQFVNIQGFENVHAYTWGNGEPQQGEWPGAAMTLINEQASYGGQYYPIYQLDFKAEAAPEFIAFNNGGIGEGNQTEDLVFENGKRYIVLDMKGKIAATVKEPMQLDYSDKVKFYNGMPQILWGEPKTLPVEFKVGDAIHIRIVDCKDMRSPALQLMSDDGKVYLTERLATDMKEVPAIVTIPITGALYEWMKDEQHKVRLCGTNVWIDRMTVEEGAYEEAATTEEENTISVWVPESEEGDEITKEKTVEIPATSFVVSDVKEEEVVKIKASTVEPNPIIAKRRALAATDISIMKKGSSDVKLVADDAIRVSEDGYEFTVSDEATVTELKTNGFDIKNNTEKPIKIKAVEVKKIPVPKYYLVGTMNEWAIQAQNELTPNNEGEGEFMITLDLAADDEIKVVMSTDASTVTTWYPDGMDNNYKITESGNYSIFFRPDGQGGDSWYYGFFYVQLNEGTGIKSVKNAAALKGAQIYTISGQRVDKAQKGLYIVNGKKVVIK